MGYLMFKTKPALLAGVLFSAVPVAFAAVNNADVFVQATPSTSSTLSAGKKVFHLKTFDLILYDRTGHDINLSANKGCFKALDDSGHKFNVFIYEADLMGPMSHNYQPNNPSSPPVRTGSITFYSSDDSVNGATSVIWDDGEKCESFTKNNP